MILKSLIIDDSRLTLDCAKATITKGSEVDLPDDLYYHPEVQGALKLEIVELVGDVPAPPPGVSSPAETKSYRNNTETRLTFDCIKASAGPKEVIDIPEDMLGAYEIDNAINNGMLVLEIKGDVGDAEEATEEPANEVAPDEPNCMLFEEVTVEETEEPEPKKKPKKKAKKFSKKKAKKSNSKKSEDEKPKAIKAKGIKRTAGSSEDEGEIIDTSSQDNIVLDTSTSTDGDDFYSESPKYEDTPEKKAPAKPQKPKAKDETPPAEKSKEEGDWDFFDIFGATDGSD